MVSERELFSRHVVERRGQALGEPPAIDENHRRAVLADQRHQPLVHGRPDRTRAGWTARGGPAQNVFQAVIFRRFGFHDGFGQLDAQAQRLLLCGIDDRHGPLLELVIEAHQ